MCKKLVYKYIEDYVLYIVLEIVVKFAIVETRTAFAFTRINDTKNVVQIRIHFYVFRFENDSVSRNCSTAWEVVRKWSYHRNLLRHDNGEITTQISVNICTFPWNFFFFSLLRSLELWCVCFNHSFRISSRALQFCDLDHGCG